jgi:Transglutaminase-like superfamily
LLSSIFKALLRRWDLAIAVILVLMAALQLAFQFQERWYLQEVTHAIVKDAGAKTTEEKVLALRGYIRKNVEFRNAPTNDRPFLRATAAETLQSGKGYCGEVSRTFICMARVLDIRAQRINLYGKKPHVVAEAELSDGQNVIVDCQNPPHIAGLEPLDKVMLRGDYDDYSTLNVRRLGLDGLFSRIKMQMGPFVYWGENPHALKALVFVVLAFGLLLIRPFRWSIRTILQRRGWIHQSDLAKFAVVLKHPANGTAPQGVDP